MTIAGVWTLGSKNSDHLGSAGPQALEVVILSLFRTEYVYYDIAEVQQHPTGSVSPFPMETSHLLVLQRLGYVFLKTFNLPRGIGGHYNEVVGKGGHTTQVQHHNVGGKLV